MIKRQNDSKRTLLLLSGFLAAVGTVAGIWTLSQARHTGAAERLSDELPKEQLLAVRDGYAYLSKNLGSDLERVSVHGGGITKCFNTVMPDQRVAARDAFYVVTHDVPKVVRQAEVGGGMLITMNTPLPSDFRLSPSRPGDKRRWVKSERFPIVHLLRYAWGSQGLQEVPLPAQWRSGGVKAVAATADGVYFTQSKSEAASRVTNKKEVRFEYPPDTTLFFLPFAGKSQTAAAGLARPYVRASDGVVCWDELQPYPNKKPVTSCRVGNRIVANIPVPGLMFVSNLAATERHLWWVQPVIGQVDASALYELNLGDSKAHAIEPPLRRSEADTIKYQWIRQVGNHWYLLCTVEWAYDKDRDPLTDPEQESPLKHTYLVRLNPERAGTPKFWGKQVVLPAKMSDAVLDDTYLYFMREEKAPSLLVAVRDLLSSAAVGQPVKNVLYRVALP